MTVQGLESNNTDFRVCNFCAFFADMGKLMAADATWVNSWVNFTRVLPVQLSHVSKRSGPHPEVYTTTSSSTTAV
jgi:hypothetical protein